MFKNKVDYEALWDEIENELDTDIAIEEFQEPADIYPSLFTSDHYRPVAFDPTFFIFFPHRRRYFL